MNGLQELAPLGVGGILAGVLFFFYRKDANTYIEQWRGQSALVVEIVKQNTQALAQNTEVLRSLHRRLDRLDGDKRD